MSRTGRKPIPIPEKVKIRLEGDRVYVEGPLGKLNQKVIPAIQVEITPKEILIKRSSDEPNIRGFHGLFRALIANMVKGVSQGFKKELDIHGVGYRAEVKGQALNLNLGFSNPVIFPLPEGIKVKVDKQTHLEITGFDKALVGQVAADIRKIRPPEPYKAKGVRYSDEIIRRKAGKAAATGGAGGK